MDTVFDRFRLLPTWVRFVFVVTVYIGMYFILSTIYYTLELNREFFENLSIHLASGSVIRYPVDLIIKVQSLFNGIGMSVVAILIFRLILLTYFDGKRTGNVEIILTPIYSLFGVFVFTNFLMGVVPGGDLGLLKAELLIRFFVIRGGDPNSGWVRWDNVNGILSIISIAIVIILILQILYLQHSGAKSIASRAYWKVVIYLAIVFCAAYIFLDALPVSGIPVTGSNDDSIIVYITTTTGLVSAISALYAQILAGKKLRMEMELLNAQKVFPKGSKSKTSKNTKQRKSKQHHN